MNWDEEILKSVIILVLQESFPQIWVPYIEGIANNVIIKLKEQYK